MNHTRQYNGSELYVVGTVLVSVLAAMTAAYGGAVLAAAGCFHTLVQGFCDFGLIPMVQWPPATSSVAEMVPFATLPLGIGYVALQRYRVGHGNRYIWLCYLLLVLSLLLLPLMTIFAVACE